MEDSTRQAFARYANDADFNAKVQAGFAAVEASDYITVKHAVIAIALHAALPPAPEPKPEDPNEIKVGDLVRVLPDPKIFRQGMSRPHPSKTLKAGELRNVKNADLSANEGMLSLEPGYVILPEYVEKVQQLD